MKHTKIIATISDRRCDVDFIRSLYKAGMNAARINSAHVTEQSARVVVDNIRTVSDDIAIILDTKGPEIRLSSMSSEDKIPVKAGDKIEVRGMVDGKELSTAQTLYVSYGDIVKDMHIGGSILIDDGELELKVESKTNITLHCEVCNDGMLAPRKSVNLPGVKVSLPSVTERDHKFIEWATENGVDFIAHSFVRSAADVEAVQKILDSKGSSIKIISKIENQEGVDNIDEILEPSYGVMVARGDLGVELAAEHIPIVQRIIVERAIAAKRPVIIATQMLHSMIKSPRPTRAEVSDIANAIYQRADAVMLSGETANGDYPVQAVETMARVAQQIEQDSEHFSPLLDINMVSVDKQITAELAHAAVRACVNLPIKAMMIDTMTGRTGRYMAAFRGQRPIYAVCYKHSIQRLLSISYGVRPLYRERYEERESLLVDTLTQLEERKCLNKSDLIVVVGGDFDPSASASFLEINSVEKLIKRKGLPI